MLSAAITRAAGRLPAAAAGHLRRCGSQPRPDHRLDKLAARPGYQLIYSVGWELVARRDRRRPGQAWQIAVDERGEVRERRADDACNDLDCGHRRCWIEEAHVTELTALLREGPVGDQLAGWPAKMRIFGRRERPHPGAQLTLFEAEDGWRYTLWVTNLPRRIRGWRGELAYINAAHRVHARVEDAIRTGKDCGIGKFPPGRWMIELVISHFKNWTIMHTDYRRPLDKIYDDYLSGSWLQLLQGGLDNSRCPRAF